MTEACDKVQTEAILKDTNLFILASDKAKKDAVIKSPKIFKSGGLQVKIDTFTIVTSPYYSGSDYDVYEKFQKNLSKYEYLKRVSSGDIKALSRDFQIPE